MHARLRLSAWWENQRGSLWLLPTLLVLLALVLGTTLASLPTIGGRAIEWVGFSGSAEGARNVLTVIAGAMVTVTGLTFSLTVVALQMASTQFSPRVLREFLTARGTEFVLAVFLATFAYCLAVIRVIRDGGGGGGGGEVVPRLAVTVGILLALGAVAALVYFIHHLTRQLRVDTIMDDLVAETLHTIDRVYRDPVRTTVIARALPSPPGQVHRVAAKRSGYLQAVTTAGLVDAARRLDAVVQLRAAVGAQISEGATLAWIWPRDGQRHVDGDRKAWDRAAHDHVHLGSERTMQQDVAFGLQQLVDIACRAISPGINDPTTAIDAFGRLARLICRLATRNLDVGTTADADGQERAIVPMPTFADYLGLACSQPRRYGARDAEVLLALLKLLTDAAEVASAEHQREAIEHECGRTLEMAEHELDATDMARLHAAAELVGETLAAHGRPRDAMLAT